MIPELPFDTELLVMCSTKSRSGRIQEMIDSFNRTKKGKSELVVYVSDDDPELDKYNKILESTKHIIGPNRTMINVLNYLSIEAYPGIRYYAEVNDDHVYMTEGWDIKMMRAIKEREDWGIAYGYTRQMPTAIMMSGKVVRTLGYFYHPIFTHTFVDDALVIFGKETDLFISMPGINIDHRHYSYGLAGMDNTYKAVVGTMGIGKQQFNTWVKDFKDMEINKIKKAMEAYNA